MSPEDRAACLEAREAAQARSIAKKAARTEFMRRILAMHDDGEDAAAIGKAIGKSARRVCQFAAERGVLITRSDAKVRRAVTLERDREVFLRRLATDWKATPAQALSELVALALEGVAAVARRVLGVRKGAACAQHVVSPVIPIGKARATLNKARPQQDDVRPARTEDFLAMAGTMSRRPS